MSNLSALPAAMSIASLCETAAGGAAGNREDWRLRDCPHVINRQEDERRFVTPEAIRATCLTGEPDEIIARIRELENAGIQEIVLMSPADYQRKVYRDVAELVLPAFR